MRDGWKGQDRLARAVDDLSGGLVVVGAGLGVASEPGTLAILQRERERERERVRLVRGEGRGVST